MAISQTTRLGVYTWSSGSDEFTRDQMSDSHQALEDRVALFLAGTFASRPAASSGNARGFYLATDQNILYYSDGSNWYSVNSFSNPVAITPGDVNTAGSSTFAARADHKHALPEWGVVGELAQTGTSAAAGTTAKFARIDHRHTLGAGSVLPGTIAVAGISAANQFANGVVQTAAIGDGQITKAKLASDQQTPSGAIMAYAGTSAPSGWLFCDGSSYAVNTYPELAAALSGRYGGSATPGQNFNVPDLRDRFPRGGATTGASVTTAGADSITLALNQLPAHTHQVGTLGVTQHTDHVHTLAGTGAAATSGSAPHEHGVGSFTADGGLFDGTVVRYFGGTFLVFGGGNDPYQLLPPYWGGRPTNAGVYESAASLANAGVRVTIPAHGTGGANNSNATHGHSLQGQSAGINGSALTHNVTGSTGNQNGTTGDPVDIRPRSVTVNYIIKT